MEVFTTLNLCTAAAVVITAAGALLAKPWREDPGRLASFPAIAIGFSLALSIFALLGDDFSVFPPKSGTQWVFWFAVACAVIGVIECAVRMPVAARGGLWLVLIFGGLWVMAQNRIHHPRRPWSTEEAWQWIGMSGAFAVAIGLAGAAVAKRVTPRPVLLGWMICAVCAAFVLVLSGKSVLMGNFTGILGACAGALALVSICFKRFRAGLGVWMTLATMLAVCVTAVMLPWFSSLPVLDAALVMAAPLMCLTALLADRASAWKPVAVTIIATLAPLAWPVGQAIQAYLEGREQGLYP